MFDVIDMMGYCLASVPDGSSETDCGVAVVDRVRSGENANRLSTRSKHAKLVNPIQ